MRETCRRTWAAPLPLFSLPFSCWNLSVKHTAECETSLISTWRHPQTPVLISEPISHPEPDGGAADESCTFKSTNLHYSIISIQTHKRCQWRTFSNLWHFLLWLEHQTLADIFKIYILYINILESYLWTPRRIQMYKLCHSRVGF